MKIAGPPGRQFILASTVDLRAWLPIHTNILGPGGNSFTDPAAASKPRLFYRSRLR